MFIIPFYRFIKVERLHVYSLVRLVFFCIAIRETYIYIYIYVVYIYVVYVFIYVYVYVYLINRKL